MIKFLGCLFFLFFGIVFVLYAFARNVLTLLFGRPARRSYEAPRSEERQACGTASGASSSAAPQEGKIFQKTEGEYVDFEEVK